MFNFLQSILFKPSCRGVSLLIASVLLIPIGYPLKAQSSNKQRGVLKKYPSDILPISVENSYVRFNSSPDFWSILPYHTGQKTNSSCSLAAVTLILNGARPSSQLEKGQKHLTEEVVLSNTQSSVWEEKTAEDGGGISLSGLEPILKMALQSHGHHSATVVRIGVDESSLEQNLIDFERRLISNDKKSSDFIIINFDQGMIMEEEESVGHFSVVGAYDQKNRKALIIDTDKDWYQPYWVPLRKLHRAMIGKRGYFHVQF